MPATWTSPRTWSIGELVTKAILDTHVRDNLLWLKTPTQAVDTAMGISTSSASLVDVTGSSISLTTNGGGILVSHEGVVSMGAGSATVQFALVLDGVAQFTRNYVVTTSPTSVNFTWHIPAVSAVAHTIKLQVNTNAGTVTHSGQQLYAIEFGS